MYNINSCNKAFHQFIEHECHFTKDIECTEEIDLSFFKSDFKRF